MKLFCAKMFCFCCLVFTYFGFVSWFLLVLFFLCRKNFFLKNKQTQIILIVSFTVLLMYTLIWTFLYLCECSWSYVWVFSFLRESFFIYVRLWESLLIYDHLSNSIFICVHVFLPICSYFHPPYFYENLFEHLFAPLNLYENK